MGYALLPHWASLAPLCSTGRPDASWFALLDVAQFAAPRRSQCRNLLATTPTTLLFEDTFAKGAMDLSPLICALGPDLAALESLDALCEPQPALALIRTGMPLEALTTHLRERLLVEAEGEAFMLRIGDTQMLAAAAVAMTPAQRSTFFAGIEAWLVADFAGRLHDLAAQTVGTRAGEPVKLPLVFDSLQLANLLEASAAPALVSQLRQLDPGFERDLDHAQQTAFADSCLMQAKLDAIDMDAELPLFALQRWQLQSRPVPGTADETS